MTITSTAPAIPGADLTLVDAIVIGVGQAVGNVISSYTADGRRVAVFESDKPGGTCLNRGCRPTKAMRASARIAHLARRAADYGVGTGEVTVDFPAVVARKDEMIDAWAAGTVEWLTTDPGIDYRHVAGRLVADVPDDLAAGLHVVEGADGRRVVAPTVWLNTGTSPVVPQIEGLDAVPHLDNDSILHLSELPEHLIVLGGNYIGLEFGQMFSRFGSTVTVIERGARLAGREEPEVSEELRRFLAAEGLDIRTGAGVTRVSKSETGGIVVTLDDADEIAGSHLLLAVGRHPNTRDIGLADVGVETDKRGYVIVDDHFATTVPGIFAVGDINGRGAFTHTSYADGEIAADNLAGGERSAGERIMTYAMFTDPPLGRVGSTEAEVRDAGINALVATYEVKNVTKAVLDSETDGFVKILVDADTDQILGASFLGLFGDEVVQIVSALMHAQAPRRILQEMLPIHPTVGEFWPTILKGLKPLD